MGAAEEKFLNDRQVEKRKILREIEQNRIKCVRQLLPCLRQYCREFHELNKSMGFPQQPEVYSDVDGAAGWYINKILLPNLPYEKNDYYHHDMVWLTNGKITRYVYGFNRLKSGPTEDIAIEYVESAFVDPKMKADRKSMPYSDKFDSEKKVKELLQYIKIVRQRIELLQRSQHTRGPRKSFSFKEWLLGYK